MSPFRIPFSVITGKVLYGHITLWGAGKSGATRNIQRP